MMSEMAGTWGSSQVSGPRTEWRTRMKPADPTVRYRTTVLVAGDTPDELEANAIAAARELTGDTVTELRVAGSYNVNPMPPADAHPGTQPEAILELAWTSDKRLYADIYVTGHRPADPPADYARNLTPCECGGGYWQEYTGPPVSQYIPHAESCEVQDARYC